MVFLKFTLFILVIFNTAFAVSEDNKLISYQSVYEISLDKDRDIKNKFGKPYLKRAEGELFLDWFNTCDSWFSNQRMYIRFWDSNGVGNLTDVSYSLEEAHDHNNMKFMLQVKDNNETIENINGNAIKDKKKVYVDLITPEKKKINLSNDTMFPHEHLKYIISNLSNGKKKFFSQNVYEGSLPEKTLNISTFIGDLSFKEESKNFSENGINNNFWDIRMAYYEGKSSTSSLELSAKINKQGVVSFFKYDYPEYTLLMKLKKIDVKKNLCE